MKVIPVSSQRIRFREKIRRTVMINELDTVVLARDIEEHELKRGDVGAVVHRYEDENVFEVEFVTGEGQTIALLTLTQADIRPMRSREILSVRELPMAA
jgi:hypothetical protein